MKKLLYGALVSTIMLTACSDDFLNRYPKGQWHHGNMPESTVDNSILVEGKIQQAYADLRSWGFAWGGLGMQSISTPDAVKGSTASDGGVIAEFETLSFTASNANIGDYYSACYRTIYKANEAIALQMTLPDSVVKKETYLAEALFLRALMYYRLTQAYGAVPYADRVLSQNDKSPDQMAADEIRAKYIQDLIYAIPHLPTRQQLVQSGNGGRATQNAARALIAKTYMYQKNYDAAMGYTAQIINSGDNSLSTPYDQCFHEAFEYGPESILEAMADEKPDEKIFQGSQFSQIQGVRGVPDLGWGINAPSQELMAAYEEGDPRKKQTIISHLDVIEGTTIKAQAGAYQHFNKKYYPIKAERGIYGRSATAQGQWINPRLIRYADIVLMHAECAVETGNIDEALSKLEMVRERARGGNSAVLPKIESRDLNQLREKVRHERRIELAMEFERYFDLVRWGIAKDVLPNFVVGKHELYPIPQSEIDKGEGAIKQNDGY